VEVIFQRSMDAVPVHDNRLGRALDALGTAGLDRLDGAVIRQASARDARDLARLPTEATRLKRYGA
jgi:hypothetical protein